VNPNLFTSLTLLKNLDLSYNWIENIDLVFVSKLENLKFVDLAKNRLNELVLGNIKINNDVVINF